MIKSCEDCFKDFKVTRHNSRWCDVCLVKREFNPPRNKDGEVSRKYLLKPRNFDNLNIKKQWQESSKKSQDKLMSKVKGSNYYN